MKILLINPPIPLSFHNREYYLPSGLMYLASVLKENGEEVKILDLKPRTSKFEKLGAPENFYENIIIDAVFDFNPDFAGFGCLYSGNFFDILKFSEAIKKKFSKVPIAVGGIHPTIYPSEILKNCPSIDWIFLGESEETIIKVVNRIKDKSYEFSGIDGFAFRKSGEVMVNSKTDYIQDLDAIPFPDYSLLNIEDYSVDTSCWHNPKKLLFKTSFPIISSRSCPNQCPFCSMFMLMGPRWRPRSATNVVDEIEYFYNKYNQNHFLFMDDNMTLGKARTLEICREIVKRGLNIQFETPNGISINTLDEEVMEAMVSAGLVRVSLAIESGSDYIRNSIMKKRLDRKKIFEIVKFTKKYKQLYTKAFFIIGMPEETKETLEETYRMIKEIDVDRVYIHNVVPYPGTKLFEQALRDNLFVDISVDNLYKSPDLYVANWKRIFIKPYNLSLDDLRKFRFKCESLIMSYR